MGIKQTIEGLFKSARGLWSSPQYQVVATPKRDYEDIRKVNAALLPLLSLGLIAAIPAVLAYNKLSNDLGRYATRLESFAGEFGAILSRRFEEAA